MSLQLFKLFVLLAIPIVGFVRAVYDLRLETVTKIEGDTETLIEFNLRPIGRQHHLNGTIVNHVDFDDTYDFIGNAATRVNGEWKPSAINGRWKFCTFMINIYEKYFQPSFKDSNMPKKGREGCPFKKGEYYIRNAEVIVDNWASYAGRGHNSLRLIVVKNNITYGGVLATGFLIDRNI